MRRSSLKFTELKTLARSHDLLEVGYEECLLSENGPDFSKIFDFLGIPKLSATWLNCEKVAPPPEEYISNYDKMRKVFQESNLCSFSK